MSNASTRIAGMRDYHGDTETSLSHLRTLINKVFSSYGYSPIEPPVIESADVFFDRSGEEIRRRMYVFQDPGNREICLRPELTIPTCRLYLREFGLPAREMRLSYVGPVFRYEMSPGEGRYRQFYQAGVECIGAAQKAMADAEVLALAVDALECAGVRESCVEISDLEIIHSFIEGLEIGENWRAQLRRYIWRLSELRNFLEKMRLSQHNSVDDSATTIREKKFLNILLSLGPEQSKVVVEELLSLTDTRQVGSRSAEEIAERLVNHGEEGRPGSLPIEIVETIEMLLNIKGPPEICLDEIEEHARDAGVQTMGPVLDQFAKRLTLFREYGLRSADLNADLSLHRGIEYYSGFIFEIHLRHVNKNHQICGGGRYDKLLRQLGASRDIPSVGFAIGLDRLQLALEKQRLSEHTESQMLDALVVAAGNVSDESCVRVTTALRRAGWSVQLDLSARRPRSALEYALKHKVRHVVFVGEEELQRGEVQIKNLARRHEEAVALDRLQDYVNYSNNGSNQQ